MENDALRMSDHMYKKSRKYTQPTKKMDCPVSFSVKKIMIFYETKLPKNNKYNRTNAGRQLKEQFIVARSKNSPQIGQLVYLLKWPTEPHENHNIGEAAGLIEPLDKRVNDFLREQIRSGCKGIRDLESRAEGYVNLVILPTLSDNDFHRRRYTPSRRKLRNIIISEKLKNRYAKVDQINVEQLVTDKWSKWGDIWFEGLSKRIEAQTVENDIDLQSDEEVEKVIKNLATHNTDVVRTNVNFQVVAIFVLQEETQVMIVKALTLIKSWNPDIEPKYAMVDFDEEEIYSLESVFPNIKVYLCNFHREQCWHRWISKLDNGVQNIAQQVKIYLRRIAHSENVEECRKATSEFLSWEFCKDKLLKWFHGTWLPEIKRWCLAYRPDDMMFNNTNNGTERLNEDLKYDDLANYKYCSLSEMLTVVIENFIPKHYRKYVELNVRYSEGYKKYNDGVPSYFRNRPKQLVNILLNNESKVTSSMVNSVKRIDPITFGVNSSEVKTNNINDYIVCIGNEDKFCSCSCSDYRRHRIICKHFFAVFKSGMSTFENLTTKFLNHSWSVLDPEIFVNSSKKEAQCNTKPTENKNEQQIDDELNSISNDNNIFDLQVNNFDNKDKSKQLFNKHYANDFKTRQPISKCYQIDSRSKLKRLMDLTYLVKDENILDHMNTDLDTITALILKNLSQPSGLIKRDSPIKKFKSKTSLTSKSILKPKSNLSSKNLFARKRKHPFSGRCGQTAEMMKQCYRANLELNTDSSDQEDIIIEICEEEKQHVEDKMETGEEELVITQLKKGRPGELKFYRFHSIFDSNMEKVIQSGDWLTCNEINHAQLLLHKQFPFAEGLEDTGLGPLLKMSKLKSSRIQIIYSNNHWITFAAETSNNIKVFDSLSSNPLHHTSIKQICHVVNCNESILRILIEPTQQQQNGSDCGLFAIAYATDILFGINPVDSNYDHTKMRAHLVDCFRQNLMSTFPQASFSKRIKRGRQKIVLQDIFCSCRMSFFDSDVETDKGLFMAQCSNCSEWFHKRCQNIPTNIFKNKNYGNHWKCSRCQ
nr:uncharacterized protein LOC105849580 [Hydra vulgaris]